MKRSITLFILVGSLLVLFLGCTPKYYAVFINSTTENVVVSLVSVGDGRIFKEFELLAGASIRTPIILVRGRFSFQSGKVIEKEVPPLDPHQVYKLRSERLMYFLITETNVYPIPKEYRNDWDAHYQEIVGATNAVLTPSAP